ncbi:MAG: PPC domain-containing DNA-binding protein [Halobacteriaceae archaeon]
MQYREVSTEKEVVARMEHGEDWRSELETLAYEIDAHAAWFIAMGAVEDAEILYYDQDELEYKAVSFDEPLEVAACIGNVSLLDDELFAHTHAVLSRRSGQALAGHLDRASVFAGEVYMRAFEQDLKRTHDTPTDLDLWL